MAIGRRSLMHGFMTPRLSDKGAAFYATWQMRTGAALCHSAEVTGQGSGTGVSAEPTHMDTMWPPWPARADPDAYADART